MGKSIKVTPKKRGRGRPATGKDPILSTRVPKVLIGQIQTWADKQGATRSEAVRRLVEIGLSVSSSTRPQSPKTRAKAADMAAATIDRQADKAASPDEQESRKRRLLKGPKEFRDLRKDHK
jgi:hypothetical protein